MRRILGNVGSFKLPNGKYGFGRIFKSPCVAFYKHIGETEKDVPPTEDYAFIVGVYDYAVTEMKMVEKRMFESIEEVTAIMENLKTEAGKLQKESCQIPYHSCSGQTSRLLGLSDADPL